MNAQIPKSHWYQSLGARVILFLTIALLPIAMIAIFQSSAATRAARANLELSLLGLTNAAVAQERSVVQRAFGAIPAMTALLTPIEDDPDACRKNIRAFLELSGRYTYAGRQSADGVVRCSSADDILDFSGSEQFAALAKDPRRIVTARLRGQVSKTAVLIIAEPLEKNGAFDGYVSVSVPLKSFPKPDPGERRPVDLIMFSATGEALTSLNGMDDISGNLPMGIELSELGEGPSRAFSKVSNGGASYVYAVVPVVDDVVFGLGIWEVSGNGEGNGLNVRPEIFPILMWLCSVLVAYLALDHLALRRIKNLSSEIRQFGMDRTPPAIASAGFDGAQEVRALEEEFSSMANVILRDEASLEDALREKNFLLQELHHRVKNNLQLISSIMNMQSRAADKPETKSVLRSLQDRVLGLATIHRSLYQSDDLARANAGALVREMAEQLSGTKDTGLSVEIDVLDVIVFPDQAVPLTLLVSEAITNARKYVGPDESGKTWLSVALKELPEEKILVEVINSMPPEQVINEPGLGSQLMQAFSTQLAADFTHKQIGDQFVTRAVFTLKSSPPSQTKF